MVWTTDPEEGESLAVCLFDHDAFTMRSVDELTFYRRLPGFSLPAESVFS